MDAKVIDVSVGVPVMALSILQPWASLIVQGLKDIENRDWKPWNPGLKFRGRVLVHAGKGFDGDAAELLERGVNPATGLRDKEVESWGLDFRHMRGGADRGGIVGEVEIVDCVTESRSKWFVGPYGFVLRNARMRVFRPCRGRLGFFRVEEA